MTLTFRILSVSEKKCMAGFFPGRLEGAAVVWTDEIIPGTDLNRFNLLI